VDEFIERVSGLLTVTVVRRHGPRGSTLPFARRAVANIALRKLLNEGRICEDDGGMLRTGNPGKPPKKAELIRQFVAANPEATSRDAVKFGADHGICERTVREYLRIIKKRQ
jgi:hypothetical protein